MAPSSTRSERSTSIVKSTCPGVSKTLTWCPRHTHEVAAAVMVMPCSCSCCIQSITAAPSWPHHHKCDRCNRDLACDGGLARIDVRHNADVAHMRQRKPPLLPATCFLCRYSVPPGPSRIHESERAPTGRTRPDSIMSLLTL